MYTNSPLRYRIFAEEFYDATGEICHVLCADELSVITEGSVAIIDNMIDSGINSSDIIQLCDKCSHVYITLEGTSANAHICTCKKNLNK